MRREEEALERVTGEKQTDSQMTTSSRCVLKATACS